LDWLKDIRVPHSWFTSFYAVAVVCSFLGGGEVLVHGPLFRANASMTGERFGSMTFRQVMLTWLFFTIQGSRRLYECVVFTKGSKSEMWFGHWVLGICFYITTSVAVWAEGIRTSAPAAARQSQLRMLTSNDGAAAIQAHRFSTSDLAITAPDLKTFIATLLFILASGFQHDCHAYLASLKSSGKDKKDGDSAARKSSSKEQDTYQLPTHPAFSSLIAPHYTAECVIYLALAILAAPSGAWLNGTLACALVFVVVNLGVTAQGTREWYLRRFGKEGVEGRWRMIPFIF
jgi:3-oxo-5-alpha-steroid 4-dehydrogenase 3 / polyprenol reductase